MDYNEECFDDLLNELGRYIDIVENPIEILEVGALTMVDDVQKLPKPMSDIRKAGYTHLLETVVTRVSTRHKDEVEVGWGKWYGRIVELGSDKMRAQSHMIPTFEKNKDKYYKEMIQKFHGG